MNTIDHTKPYVDHGKGKSLGAEKWREEAIEATRRRALANSPWDAPEDPFASCRVCGGEPVSLGALGNRHHLRCRNCGNLYSEVTL